MKKHEWAKVFLMVSALSLGASAGIFRHAVKPAVKDTEKAAVVVAKDTAKGSVKAVKVAGKGVKKVIY